MNGDGRYMLSPMKNSSVVAIDIILKGIYAFNFLKTVQSLPCLERISHIKVSSKKAVV